MIKLRCNRWQEVNKLSKKTNCASFDNLIPFWLKVYLKWTNRNFIFAYTNVA
jgi:hypothetical protein